MEYDPKNPLLQENEVEAFHNLFDAEPEFMAAEGYSGDAHKAELRRLALTIIHKLTKFEEFDAFVPYLALNYFDRFLSRRGIPVFTVNWKENFRLFVICCVSIAWKMRSSNFSVDELLTSRKLETIIGAELIKPMELQILNTLQWRMRSLTSIDFVYPYLRFFKLTPTGGFTHRDILQTIIATQGDIKFTKFKPSVIAASALLSALTKEFPARFLEFKEAVFRCPYLEKEPLLLCMEAMGIQQVRGGEEVERGTGKAPLNPSAGSSSRAPAAESSSRAPAAAHGEIIEVNNKEDEVVPMNFELNWPEVELEDELNIPDPESESESESEAEPRICCLNRQALDAVAARVNNRCAFL